MILKARRGDTGFTLIEVMVVIVIIGVMASLIVVSVSLGDPRRELLKEAERLRTILSMASEEAIIQQVELGAEFTDKGYRFMRWEQLQIPGEVSGDGNEDISSVDDVNAPAQQTMDPQTGDPLEPQAEWQLLQTDDILRDHELPEGMRMTLEVDYEQVDIAASREERSAVTTEDALMPSLYFLSSGEMTPFRIEMFLVEDAGNPVFIEGDVLGQVRVVYEPTR